jgi:FtsZ-interacting cell division protein YlmF
MAPALPFLPARAETRSPRNGCTSLAMAPGILVLQPRGMADGQRAIEAVRSGQSVVLDASALDPTLGQRLVDYTCGGVQAMDGQSRRLGEAVFLFTSGLSWIEDPPELRGSSAGSLRV